MKIRSKILEIQYLAIICTEIGFDCFTRYSGHINCFEIDFHEGKWRANDDTITQSFDVDDSRTSLEKANRIIYQLKHVIRKNKLNYEELVQVQRVTFDYRF